jgi:hypothetical protein
MKSSPFIGLLFIFPDMEIQKQNYLYHKNEYESKV